MEPEQTDPATADTPSARSRRSIIGFILAFIVPPLGAFISILAWREIRKKSLKGKGLAIFGTVWGILFTLPFVFLVFLFIAFRGWEELINGNAAERGSKPFIAQIKQAGGQKLCDNGNDGYGIDNTTPWYDAYYQIPDKPGLTNEIKSLADQDGYYLRTDTAAIKQLQQNSYFSYRDQEQFNPKSDYLIAHNGGKTLSVTVNRDTSVALDCGSGKWGRLKATGNDTAILEIDFTFPDTN